MIIVNVSLKQIIHKYENSTPRNSDNFAIKKKRFIAHALTDWVQKFDIILKCTFLYSLPPLETPFQSNIIQLKYQMVSHIVFYTVHL